MSCHFNHPFLSKLPSPRRAKYSENKSRICAMSIFHSQTPGLGASSFAFILRTAYNYRPITLLTLMDTLAAFIIILPPSNVIDKICPFFFFLFPKSGMDTTYHFTVAIWCIFFGVGFCRYKRGKSLNRPDPLPLYLHVLF